MFSFIEVNHDNDVLMVNAEGMVHKAYRCPKIHIDRLWSLNNQLSY